MKLEHRQRTTIAAVILAISGCKTLERGVPGKLAESSSVTTGSTLTDLAESALSVAQLYQERLAQAGEAEIAKQLQAEIDTIQSNPDPQWVAPDFGIGFFPKLSVIDDNPYLKALYTSADEFLSAPEDCQPLSTRERSLYPKQRYQDARKVGGEIEQLFFLIASSQSRYRYHPRLVRQFFCRLYATAYDYYLHGGQGLGIPGSTPNALDDWFATGPMIYGWAMAERTMGGIIPASLKKLMTVSAQRAGEAVLAVSTTPRYANRDISYAEILLQAGQLLRHAPYIKKAEQLWQQTCDSIYPDGAFPYIWNQNECINYHAGNLRSIARIHAMTGSEQVKNCLIKAGPYEVLTVEPGNVSEYYTSPAWKTMWNSIHGVGGAEPVAALSQSPVLRGMIDQAIAAEGAAASPLYASFYRKAVAAQQPPDRYIVWDRNILGPRGRFGTFSYALTGRDVTSERTTDPGHLTLVGAMLTEDLPGSSQQRRLQAALMAVYPKVHVLASRDGQEWNSWAYLRSQLQANTLLLQGAAGFGAISRLQTQASGPSAKEHPWSATELWLSVDDRLIGLVEVSALEAVKAFQVNGRIKLGYGRTGSRQPQGLVPLTPGSSFRYGGLIVRLHEHSFANVTTAKAGILRDDPPLDASEIILSDRSGPSAEVETRYEKGAGHFFVVEIARADAPALTTVALKRSGPLRTLLVRKADRVYFLGFNTSAADAAIDIDSQLPNAKTSVWLASRHGDKPRQLSGSQFTLGARGLLLALATPDAKDSEPGWQSLNELLAP